MIQNKPISFKVCSIEIITKFNSLLDLDSVLKCLHSIISNTVGYKLHAHSIDKEIKS